METLKISKDKAKELYPKASDEFKAMLEETFGRSFFLGNVTDRIKTYEDAKRETGYGDVDYSAFPEKLRKFFEAAYKLVVITEALNEGWKPDWNDEDQKKWIPWFYPNSSSGFVFSNANYGYSYACAGYGLRLCFKSDELARYAGKQFVEIYKEFILNK